MEYTSREQRRAIGAGGEAPQGWGWGPSGDARCMDTLAAAANAYERKGVSGPLWRKLARFSPRVQALLCAAGERGDDARSVFQETVLLGVEGTTAAQVQDFLTGLWMGRTATLVPAQVVPNSPAYAKGYAEGCAAVRRASGEIAATQPVKKQRRMSPSSPVNVVPGDGLAEPLPSETFDEATLVWEFVQTRRATYGKDMIAAQISMDRTARALAFAAKASRHLVILEGDYDSASGATATIFDKNQQLANRVRTVLNVRKMKDLDVQFRDVVYDCDRLAILKECVFQALMGGDIRNVAGILPTIDEKYVRWEKRGDKTKGKSGKNNSYFRHMAYGQACCEALRIKRFRDDAPSMDFVRKMFGFWRAESFKAMQRSAREAPPAPRSRAALFAEMTAQRSAKEAPAVSGNRAVVQTGGMASQRSAQEAPGVPRNRAVVHTDGMAIQRRENEEPAVPRNRAVVHAGGATQPPLEVEFSTANAGSFGLVDADTLGLDFCMDLQDQSPVSLWGVAKAPAEPHEAPMLTPTAMNATEVLPPAKMGAPESTEVLSLAKMGALEAAAFGDFLFGNAFVDMDILHGPMESGSQDGGHDSVCARFALWVGEGDEFLMALDNMLNKVNEDGTAAAVEVISWAPTPDAGAFEFELPCYLRGPALIAHAEV